LLTLGSGFVRETPKTKLKNLGTLSFFRLGQPVFVRIQVASVL